MVRIPGWEESGLDTTTPSHQRLWGVLPGGAASEVAVHHQDRGVCEARVVEGVDCAPVAELCAIIGERVIAETVEGDALEKAGRNDAVGVDVVAANGDAAARDDVSLGGGHCILPFGYAVVVKTRRASATSPVSADAATIAGDMSKVLPVGDPCRPLKLRLDEDAQT